MVDEVGDIKIFNPQKEISRELTLDILIRHRDAMKQARTGQSLGVPIDNITDNDRKYNQARALNLIIASQREMITLSRPLVWFRSTQQWKKKYKEEEEQNENPFEKHENDYNKIMDWLKFLRHCENAILDAEKTKMIEDDFIVVTDSNDGKVVTLTNNFYEMLEDLESSYEQVFLLMLINKIVSAGIEEDEELTYKQKEEEAINRVVDA